MTVGALKRQCHHTSEPALITSKVTYLSSKSTTTAGRVFSSETTSRLPWIYLMGLVISNNHFRQLSGAFAALLMISSTSLAPGCEESHVSLPAASLCTLKKVASPRGLVNQIQTPFDTLLTSNLTSITRSCRLCSKSHAVCQSLQPCNNI